MKYLEMISISTAQVFRSGVFIFHLCRPMAFVSLSFCGTPGLTPHMNVLFWGSCDFIVSYSNRHTSSELEIVIQEVFRSIRASYLAVWSLPLANDKWHSGTSYSDFLTDQNFHQFMTLIPNLILLNCKWFPWSICNGCDRPVRNSYPSAYLVPSLLGLAYAPIFEISFP